MDAWISLLTDVVFPVSATFCLLHRIEGKRNSFNRIHLFYSGKAKIRSRKENLALAASRMNVK